jgi:hypothetical protein
MRRVSKRRIQRNIFLWSMVPAKPGFLTQRSPRFRSPVYARVTIASPISALMVYNCCRQAAGKLACQGDFSRAVLSGELAKSPA